MGKFAILHTTRGYSTSTGATPHSWPHFPQRYKRVISSWCSVRKDAGKTNYYSANLYWDEYGNFQVACSANTAHAVDIYAIVEINQT